MSASQRSLLCCLLEHYYGDLDWEEQPEYAHHVRYEADNLLQMMDVSRDDAVEAECERVVSLHFPLDD